MWWDTGGGVWNFSFLIFHFFCAGQWVSVFLWGMGLMGLMMVLERIFEAPFVLAFSPSCAPLRGRLHGVFLTMLALRAALWDSGWTSYIFHLTFSILHFPSYILHQKKKLFVAKIMNGRWQGNSNNPESVIGPTGEILSIVFFINS